MVAPYVAMPDQRRAIRPMTGPTGNTGRELDPLERARMMEMARMMQPPTTEDAVVTGMDQPTRDFSPIVQTPLPPPGTPVATRARDSNKGVVPPRPVARPATTPGPGVNDGALEQQQTAAGEEPSSYDDWLKWIGTGAGVALGWLAGPSRVARTLGNVPPGAAGAAPTPGTAVVPTPRVLDGEVIPPAPPGTKRLTDGFEEPDPFGHYPPPPGSSFNPNYRDPTGIPHQRPNFTTQGGATGPVAAKAPPTTADTVARGLDAPPPRAIAAPRVKPSRPVSDGERPIPARGSAPPKTKMSLKRKKQEDQKSRPKPKVTAKRTTRRAQ